jgi:hypothetical protein
MFPGSNDTCCGGCVGHQYVCSARKAHQERTGESIDLRTFARERLDLGAHPFVERVRHSAWMSRDHGI